MLKFQGKKHNYYTSNFSTQIIIELHKPMWNTKDTSKWSNYIPLIHSKFIYVLSCSIQKLLISSKSFWHVAKSRRFLIPLSFRQIHHRNIINRSLIFHTWHGLYSKFKERHFILSPLKWRKGKCNWLPLSFEMFRLEYICQ